MLEYIFIKIQKNPFLVSDIWGTGMDLIADANSFSHCILSFEWFGGKPQDLDFDCLDITMAKKIFGCS